MSRNKELMEEECVHEYLMSFDNCLTKDLIKKFLWKLFLMHER